MKKRFFAVLMALCMMFSMTTVALAADAEGTESNPEVIDTLEGTVSQADDQEGYWYSYTAPSKGYLEPTSVVSTNEEATAGMKVINTRTGAEATGGDRAYANAGDTLLIQVFSRIYNWDTYTNTYDAATITWAATYTEAGTANKPDAIEMDYIGTYQTTIESTIETGAEGYYYSYAADVTGLMTLYVEYSDDSNVEIILTTEDGQEEVYSTSEATYDVTNPWTGMSNSYKAVQIQLTKNEVVKIHISSQLTQVDEVMVAWTANIIAPYASEGNPVQVYDMPSEAFTIPVGEKYYFAADSFFQKTTLVVAGEDIAVYDAAGNKGTIGTDGLTDVELVLDEDTYTCIFSVENTGDEPAEVAFDVEYPEGSSQNPAVIEDKATHTFEDEDYMYYVYKWTAPADGILTVKASSTSAWSMYAENQETYASSDYLSSEEPADAVMIVAKDDVIYIYTNSAGEAGTVTTEVVFAEAVAGILDTEAYEDTVNEIYDAIYNQVELDDEYVVALNMLDGEGNVVASIVPTDVLTAVKEYKETFETELPIVLVMDEYSWYIENVTDVKPVDLGVKLDTTNIPEELADKAIGDSVGAQFSLPDCADFGFDAILYFDAGEELAGEYFSLFYYNEDGNLECVGNDVVADGLVGFAFEHASDYLLVAGNVTVGTIIEPDVVTPPGNTNPGGTTNPGNTTTPGGTTGGATGTTPEVEAPKTGDTTNFALWIAVLGFGVVAMAGSVVMKKREF